MVARIVGTGSAVPENIVTNDDLSRIVDTNDEWISTRTGIRERRIAKEENTTILACRAAKKALENAGMDAADVELILVATCTPDSFFPNTACRVQKEIGAWNAVGFDLSAACSGFVFALSTVQAYIRSGVYKNALLIGAETLSKLLNWEDRGTCVLFGDGAGAVVVKAHETGFMDMVQWSDGRGDSVLTCGARQMKNVLAPGAQEADYVAMEGQPVFKFAVKKVPECITQVLEKTGTEKEEIRYYVLHQANSRIIQSVAKRLKESEEKFPMNLERHGNTSAASIPILLDEMNREGKLEKGDKIILSGFGAGLTWGAALLEW